MNIIRRAALAAAGAALSVSSMSVVAIVGAAPADAAVSCAGQDRAEGSTWSSAHASNVKLRQKRSALAKAKQSYRRHHTKTNRTKVRKAQKAYDVQKRRASTWNARYRNAKAAAARCHELQARQRAAEIEAARKLGASEVSQRSALRLDSLGLDKTLVGPLADQLGVLLGGQVTRGGLDKVLTGVTGLLQPPSGTGAPSVGELTALLADFDVLLDANKLPVTPELVLGLIGAFGGSDLPAEALTDILTSVLSGVTGGAGSTPVSPAVLSDVLQAVLGELAAGGDPAGLVARLVDAVGGVLEGATGGTLPVTAITDSLASTLGGLLGLLLG